MAVVPPTPSQGAPRGKARRSRFARWSRRLALAGVALVIAAAVAVAGGFAWFVGRVPSHEIVLDRNADGIVALTGGRERIADAVQLLASGRGKRLLITGVHRTTNLNEIARLVPAQEGLINCCIDLDHSAVNTVGNAMETRRWANGHGFRSLVVVTSNYHMPRSMAELRRELPGVALIPYPVITEKLRAEQWWNSPETARILVAEYVKYVLARMRVRLDPPLAASKPNGGTRS
jgi:uncharacterized SAM-binding protein YcdF (DUF218 family)